MARTNPPGTLSDWIERAAAAPFRASINGDCEWGTHSPQPDLINFARISPGGRMLLAFELAEVRDYFVDGNLSQGAQLEPDNATRAGAKRNSSDPMTIDSAGMADLPLEKLVDIYVEAHLKERQADEAISLYVLPRIASLREDGSESAAASLVKSLPSNTQARFTAWDALKAVDQQAIQSARAAPLNANLARLLLDWQGAHRRQQAVGDLYAHRAMAHGRQLFDSGRKIELSDFIVTVRHGMTRAFLNDMAVYGTPNPAPEDAPSP